MKLMAVVFCLIRLRHPDGLMNYISLKMKRYSFIKVLLAVLMVLSVASCKKDVLLGNLSFTVDMEQLEADDNAKNYLSMESYIYWENIDTIAVYPCQGDNTNVYTSDGYSSEEDFHFPMVVSDANPQSATFNATGFPVDDDFNYYGIYPASAGSMSGPMTYIKMPDVYRYGGHTGSHASDPDYTFGRPGIPMVAHASAERDGVIPHMDLHTVCGVARFQFAIGGTAETKKISKIEFTGETENISGEFIIQNIKDHMPYLKETTRGTKSITIKNINKDLEPGKVLSFYLPLPATADPYEEASKSFHTYNIKVTITTTDEKTFVKRYYVHVRRNCLSCLPTLIINDWENPATTTTGVSGSGTQDRPFKIFTQDDLIAIREAFKMATPTINGIRITGNTYFALVTSKVVLDNTKWTKGIENFKGHFIVTNGSAVASGISNRSGHPVFESISDSGIVSGLIMRGKDSDGNSNAVTYSGTTAFSPLCIVNNGVLEDCINYAAITSATANLAGVCVTNNKTITSCANGGNITGIGGYNAAGVCYENSSTGTITGYTLSDARVKVNATQAASICHTNYGKIQTCYAQLGYTATINYFFGGLVYSNKESGIIKDCYVAGQLRSSTQVGGICFENRGIIDACYANAALTGATYMGGIAAIQEGNSAEIRNCYGVAGTLISTTSSTTCGGVVGALRGGLISNCFYSAQVACSGSGSYYGEIVGNASGGAIQNCYNGSSLANFYGRIDDASIIRYNCFDHDQSSLTDLCKYNIGTGLITSVTAQQQGATVGNALYTALNYWVTTGVGHSSPSGTYKQWIEQTVPTLKSN